MPFYDMTTPRGKMTFQQRRHLMSKKGQLELAEQIRREEALWEARMALWEPSHRDVMDFLQVTLGIARPEDDPAYERETVEEARKLMGRAMFVCMAAPQLTQGLVLNAEEKRTVELYHQGMGGNPDTI